MKKKLNKTVALGVFRKRLLGVQKTKAKKMLTNKKKICKTIQKAKSIFDRLCNLPGCKTLCQNICCFCDLLADYVDGTYQNLPLSTIVALLGGLLYLILPFDIVLDALPGIGWIDDATVLAFVVAAQKNDITEYLAWKESQSAPDVDQLPLTA